MTTRVVHANDPLALVRVDDVLGGVTFTGAPGVLYVGRANRRANNPITHVDSPYRNPWSINDMMRAGVLSEGAARRSALGAFEAWFDGGVIYPTRREWILEHVHELRGGILVCWCAKPGRPLTAADPRVCHGQLLAERADA